MEDSLNWLIIILVLVVVIGPVLYLVPNARDKRLTDLRMQARRAGLSVRITHLPKLDPEAHERVSAGGQTKAARISCSAYEKAIGVALRINGEVLLQKLPPAPTVPVREVIPGWSLDGRSEDASWRALQGDAQVLTVLQRVLNELPSDALACAVDNRTVACYWRESAQGDSEALQQIDRCLGELSQILAARFGTPKEPPSAI